MKMKRKIIESSPIKFTPYLKSVIWGGTKICRYKGIVQTDSNIGESWEISAVPGHESVVADGPYRGMRIIELIERFGPDLLGQKVFDRYKGKFPLLVKLIDANDKLSVQVHPDDNLARQRHDSFGKSEMWYIIEAEEGAKIYSGLNRAMTPEEYVKMVETDTIEEALAAHDSHPGDVFFVPAGRVHSIGGGNLLAEIQESSDITYRIYDYNRLDANGNLRELHTEQAKDAIDFTFRNDFKSAQPDPDAADYIIAECEHFRVNRLLLDGEMTLENSDESFTILMCLKGNAVIAYDDGTMSIKAGETVLIPAVLTSVSLKGKGTLLTVRS